MLYQHQLFIVSHTYINASYICMYIMHKNLKMMKFIDNRVIYPPINLKISVHDLKKYKNKKKTFLCEHLSYCYYSYIKILHTYGFKTAH